MTKKDPKTCLFCKTCSIFDIFCHNSHSFIFRIQKQFRTIVSLQLLRRNSAAKNGFGSVSPVITDISSRFFTLLPSKICIKYRKHGRSSFSHIQLCVLQPILTPNKDILKPKLAFFMRLLKAIHFVNSVCTIFSL